MYSQVGYRKKALVGQHIYVFIYLSDVVNLPTLVSTDRQKEDDRVFYLLPVTPIRS